jgi:hypothetical protein
MNENEPKNKDKDEEEIDDSFAQLAQGTLVRDRSPMDELRAAEKIGNPAVIAEAQAAADSVYTVAETPEVAPHLDVKNMSKEQLQTASQNLDQEDEQIWQTYRPVIEKEIQPAMDTYNAVQTRYQKPNPGEKPATREEYEQAKAEYAPFRERYQKMEAERNSKLNTVQEKRNQITEKLKEIRLQETEQMIQDYIKINPSKKSLEDLIKLSEQKGREEPHYSSGEELMADVNVVLSSDLSNEQKQKIIRNLGNHIQSWTIGDNMSELKQEYIRRLS